VEDHSERIQEHDLDVEDDEEHRREVEADREALNSGRAGRDAGLKRELAPAYMLMRARRKDEGEPHHRCGNDQRENRVDQERQPVIEHASFLGRRGT
jgi:hypothetical protein